MQDAEPPDYHNVIPFDGCSDGAKPPLFKVQSCADFAVLKTNGWLIKGVIPRAELVVGFGAPGSGKTFAFLDMAMAIALDKGEWFQNKVVPGRVIYLCAESPYGFKNRLLAYAQNANLPLGDIINLGIIEDAPNFLQPDDAKAIAVQIGKADVIVIDTLSRTMIGGDENTAKDMGQIVSQCKQLHALTGATIILIHHSGKQVENGARGSSVLLGAADAEIRIEQLGIDHTITITKQKDGEAGKSWGFTLKQIVIGEDDDGDEITSCVVEQSSVIITKKTKKEKLGGVQKIIMDALEKMPENPVMVDDLLALSMANMPFDSTKKDERRKRFFHSLETLQENGLVSLTNNFVYRGK